MKFTWSIMAIFALLSSCSTGQKGDRPENVVTMSFSKNIPDKKGIIQTNNLEVKDFEEAVLFASKWWPGGGNRLYPRYSKNGDFKNGFTGGVMLVLKHKDNQYTCYLAGTNNNLFSWFSTENGTSFSINTGHLGKGVYSGKNKIRYVKAASNSVYDAINKAWDFHLKSPFNSTTVKEREAKTYPEYFNYLGWCSWEGFNRSISEENLKEAVASFEKGDIPIRYLLMDAGHMQNHKGDHFQYNGLERFKPFPEKFPTNYKSLLDMRKKDKIRWMGIWLAFLGGRDGVYPINEMPKSVNDVLAKTHMNTLVPNGNKEASEVFYENFISSYVSEPGWDFTKVDFQSRALTHYAGGDESNHPVKDNRGAFNNPFEASANMSLAMEKTLEEKDLGLINCNSLNPFSIFNYNNSVVARCSEDYKLYDLGRARSHLYHSYATMPLLGKVLWGDHDMFHSSDTISGKMMAISKAMSGGPIYLSDKPNHFDTKNINPLCYTDGELLRPLAPAIPTDTSFFIDGQCEAEAYMAFAPLKNKSVAIVAYNLYAEIKLDEQVLKRLEANKVFVAIVDRLRKSGVTQVKDNDALLELLRAQYSDKPSKKYIKIIYNFITHWAKEKVVTGTIDTSIYTNASAMIQPYKGKWEFPKEGVICYDWHTKSAVKLDKSHQFTISSFGDEFFHLIPIINDWAIVGDISKYLSPSGYDLVSNTQNKLEIKMPEAGTLVVYNNKVKDIKSNIGKVSKIGDYLWEIHIESISNKIIITK